MADGAGKLTIIDRALGPAMRRATRDIVSEIIGRYVVGSAQATIYKSRARIKSIDETVPDYVFWDQLRRGKVAGYTLGGLFAKRIERVFASWVFGSGLEVALSESDDAAYGEAARDYTNARLAEFVASLLGAGTGAADAEEPGDRDDQSTSFLLQVYRDALGLGDQYVVVNPDGSLSVPSPDTVTVERDPLDYRRVLAVRIETKLQGYSIVDEYRADGRTVTTSKGGVIESVEQYANLIGRIPVVHVAYGRGGNETNGHPIHEELRPLYDQYDDLIFKQLDGAKLLGNPIPTFEGMEDVSQVITQNGPAEQDTYADKDGNTETRTQLMLDRNTIVLVGKGGTFKFAAPPTGFTEDTKTALKSLFLLLLDHTGIPEVIWGGEMSSSRSSTETQVLTQWVHDIEGEQKDAGGWIVRLCRLWLAWRALVDPRIVVGRLAVSWAPLVQQDEQVKLQQLTFAYDRDLLQPETALGELHLVDDPESEVAAAQAKADERREKLFPEGDTAGFQQRLGQEDGDEEGEG